MPIFLLPLKTENSISVDETTGGILTIPELPGFSLEIEPGSVTFPNGSKSGDVSVTLVHADKIPMTPNFGQQPRFIITIQPPGAHFDPPAKVSFPNVDGLEPGEITEFYSFDHSIGRFVTIGTGSVSEDGTRIISDPGVGIVAGGWHCGGNPQGDGDWGGLKVNFEKEVYKLKLPIGETFNVTAFGSPPLESIFINWRSDDGSVVRFFIDEFCPDQGSCTNELEIVGSGTTMIHVDFLCTTTGETITATAKVIVEAVMEDIVVIGWVNEVPLEKAANSIEPQVNPVLVEYLTGPIKKLFFCPILTLIDWPKGERSEIETDVDRMYANLILLANSKNDRPPDKLTTILFHPNIRNVGIYKANKDYRLFNRPLTNDAVVGPTPDPCSGFEMVLPKISDSEPHPQNGYPGLLSNGGTYLLNEGRVGRIGQRGNRTINFCNNDMSVEECQNETFPDKTPYVFSVVKFDENGKFLGLNQADRQIFPTYNVYKLDNQSKIFNKINVISQASNVDDFILGLVPPDSPNSEHPDFQRTVDEIN